MFFCPDAKLNKKFKYKQSIHDNRIGVFIIYNDQFFINNNGHTNILQKIAKEKAIKIDHVSGINPNPIIDFEKDKFATGHIMDKSTVLLDILVMSVYTVRDAIEILKKNNYTRIFLEPENDKNILLRIS